MTLVSMCINYHDASEHAHKFGVKGHLTYVESKSMEAAMYV